MTSGWNVWVWLVDVVVRRYNQTWELRTPKGLRLAVLNLQVSLILRCTHYYAIYMYCLSV